MNLVEICNNQLSFDPMMNAFASDNLVIWAKTKTASLEIFEYIMIYWSSYVSEMSAESRILAIWNEILESRTRYKFVRLEVSNSDGYSGFRSLINY